MSNSVLLSIEEKTATLTLNRPESMNAMNVELLNELLNGLQRVKESEANVLVITGEGKAFSAGGDIKTMLLQSDADVFHDIMKTIKDIMITLYTLPAITISAINGAAAGLGLSLALASDYVIADKKANVAMNFIGIGLIPDGAGHFFMEQRLGEVRAKHTIWEGQKFSAEQAQKLGLIDEVAVPDLNDFIQQKIDQLRSKPIKAMIETKLIYAEQNRTKLMHILDQEAIGQQKMRQTNDHKEGIQAFLDKRGPAFSGE
ncbi:Enoyl-CoA hydratase/carnithine racemase [Salinibacillus kushneri]|uniref:Enoyl-CoA hydratase/carnithine racemase n=1 Tax=Salinibacillus kushneri TaxID=237682 RepID=A0A1I0BCU4_9BACI|nr:enoyl-CoA hydratase [Salinibacillus kushneri]SET04599.1 Enoyl-CoA hydratase/carnithine racemase [Salinibacillus kushneri]